MMNARIVTNHWGKSFYITEGLGYDLRFAMPSSSPIRFQGELEVDAFLGTLSEPDITTLSQRFSPGVLRNFSYIKHAIASGKLNVIPMGNEEPHYSSSAVNASSRTQGTVVDTVSPVSLSAKFSNKHSANSSVNFLDNRPIRAVRAEIRVVLRQIIEQEQLEAKQLEKSYQKRSVFGKTGAHLQHLGTGLYNSGESFLTWMKEVDDVVSIHKRLFRILLAANAVANADTDSPYQLYQKLLSSLEKKEIVEALGFDPSLITVEKITEIYSYAKLINDDHSTQLILKHFIKDYINAQHSLEWSEIAGGATFEVILTALLALATGGVGAIASLGSKAKKLSQMKKLGKLFSELAELLKTVPKAKPSMRKLKVLGDKSKRKKEALKPIPKNDSSNSVKSSSHLHAKIVKPVKYSNTKSLDPMFEGEEKPVYHSFWGDQTVKYLDSSELHEYELTVKDGKIIHAFGSKAGEVFDTSESSSHAYGGGSAIFIMTPEGKIYASHYHEPGAFHHSSLAQGHEVAAAGELVVENGVLKEVSNQSGHYEPSQEMNDQLLSELSDRGLEQGDQVNILRTGYDDANNAGFIDLQSNRVTVPPEEAIIEYIPEYWWKDDL